MNLPAGSAESVAYHRDVRHRGQFDEDVSAAFENDVLDGQDVRSTFLDQEHFLAPFASSGRIHIDDVGIKVLEDVFDGVRSCNGVADSYVSSSEFIEIVCG